MGAGSFPKMNCWSTVLHQSSPCYIRWSLLVRFHLQTASRVHQWSAKRESPRNVMRIIEKISSFTTGPTLVLVKQSKPTTVCCCWTIKKGFLAKRIYIWGLGLLNSRCVGCLAISPFAFDKMTWSYIFPFHLVRIPIKRNLYWGRRGWGLSVDGAGKSAFVTLSNLGCCSLFSLIGTTLFIMGWCLLLP